MFEPVCHEIVDEASGLHAFLVVDDTTLGPAAGGVRTRGYASAEEARGDCHALARAMTYKCALAGLPCGGGKAVVMDHEGLDRAVAFRRLGEFVEGLGGTFRTAGDLGTTATDLEAMARATGWISTNEAGLLDALGRACLRAVEACFEFSGRGSLRGAEVAVQGCGNVGSTVATALSGAGARVLVADLEGDRARALADRVDGEVVDAEALLGADVDVLAPCAVGGVVTAAVVERMEAWMLCGAANNVLAGPEVDRLLTRRGILHVPDPIASSGAVIEGMGRDLLGLADRGPLIDRVRDTVLTVLHRAHDTARPTGVVARELAEERIRAARRGGSREAVVPTPGSD